MNLNVENSTINENQILKSPTMTENDHVLHFLRLPHPRTRTISE